MLFVCISIAVGIGLTISIYTPSQWEPSVLITDGSHMGVHNTLSPNAQMNIPEKGSVKGYESTENSTSNKNITGEKE